MAGHKLRRCTVCGKYHASYLVPLAGGGEGYYCYACWKALYPNASQADEEKAKRLDEQAGTKPMPPLPRP